MNEDDEKWEANRRLLETYREIDAVYWSSEDPPSLNPSDS
jgi:hypothetical protein